MWLLSPHTALSLLGAFAGALLLRSLTDLPPPAAVALGAIAGWFLAGIALAPVAERLDRALHRMGGPGRRRR